MPGNLDDCIKSAKSKIKTDKPIIILITTIAQY